MSFKITAQTLTQVRVDLETHALLLDRLLAAHGVIGGDSPVDERPWVQLAYHGIERADLESVLGYAGITQADSPFGLPCPIEPVEVQPNGILFSTQRLRAFVEEGFGPVLQERRGFGTVEEFLEARELSAPEYLATAVVDACLWCERREHALVIRW